MIAAADTPTPGNWMKQLLQGRRGELCSSTRDKGESCAVVPAFPSSLNLCACLQFSQRSCGELEMRASAADFGNQYSTDAERQAADDPGYYALTPVCERVCGQSAKTAKEQEVEGEIYELLHP
jgi:hypothetical protein